MGMCYVLIGVLLLPHSLLHCQEVSHGQLGVLPEPSFVIYFPQTNHER